MSSRYYRKPQHKGIILNNRSHHTDSTKREMLLKFHRGVLNYNMVDDIAIKNGYTNSRELSRTRKTRNKKKQGSGYIAPLILPYLSENINNKIRNYIRQHKLAIRPIFKPGRTLRQQFCRSRPRDQQRRVLGNSENCKIFIVMDIVL